MFGNPHISFDPAKESMLKFGGGGGGGAPMAGGAVTALDQVPEFPREWQDFMGRGRLQAVWLGVLHSHLILVVPFGNQNGC